MSLDLAFYIEQHTETAFSIDQTGHEYSKDQVQPVEVEPNSGHCERLLSFAYFQQTLRGHFNLRQNIQDR